ncbi:hypothetical protein F4813DRAFT_230350 [Daldinia decipiens]|uniref:uncharacterized protein n=1 Tax=Daldinia decipiens TaxID=326647 RepID=UPI0020C1BB06|nr:uncharacterized protein F4813DRAFT_230350 [Daldinia decipiens]KAI1661469.1 hypothetical protein F4813DRAFT_230350 [Daldinia decipiens]
MTSYYTNYPAYTGHPGYSCLCGAPLDIRYQNSSNHQFEFAGGYCHNCYRQIPLYRMRTPDHLTHSTSDLYAPWYIDNGYFSVGSNVHGWGSQSQLYQHASIPQGVNHTYYSPTTRGSCRPQYPSYAFNTSHYQNGYAVPRSTEYRQQWSAGRSEYPTSPFNDETRGRRRWPNSRRHYSCERERSSSWERSSGTQVTDDYAYSACSWTTRATAGSAGSRRSSSAASRSTINYTPSAESGEDNICASQPDQIKDKEKGKQKEVVEKKDEEEPFAVTRDGDLILFGEQWEVPSPTEAKIEAGEPVGCCDIISTHMVTDEDGNTTEIDIEEKNCKVSLVMSGGLTE